jgi:hypothetical protein
LPYYYPLVAKFDDYTWVSNTFADELFALLKIDLFPKANTLPKSMYHAKRLIQH